MPIFNTKTIIYQIQKVFYILMKKIDLKLEEEIINFLIIIIDRYQKLRFEKY